MAYAAVSYLATQFENQAGYWIKFYEQGTTTPKSMATDATGGTTLAKAEISSGGTVPIGFIQTAGDAILIPFVDGDYDLWAFPNSAEADANDTTNAIQLADNITSSPYAVALKEYDTLTAAVADVANLSIGDVVILKERTTGNGGGATWDVVDATTVTENEKNIVTGDATRSFSMRRNGLISIDTTINIPSDSSTLQEAVDFWGTHNIENDAVITLNIDTGHLLTAGLNCRNGNFSQFKITSVDAIVGLALTFVGASTTGVPAGILGETPRQPLLFGYNSTLPELHCVIDMDNLYGTGIQLAESSVVVAPNMGVINAGFRGIQVHGRANIYGANFNGAEGTGIRLQQASSCCARSATADNCVANINGGAGDDLSAGNGAVYVSRSSTLEFRSGSAQNSGSIGINARRSIVTAFGANVSGAASYGVYAQACSLVTFTDGIATNCVDGALRSIAGATLAAAGATTSTATAGTDDFTVDGGGILLIGSGNTIEGVAATESIAITESNVGFLNGYTNDGVLFYDGATAETIPLLSTTAGITAFAAFTDSTGDTDGSTGVITGMTSTATLDVGMDVNSTAGFPAVPLTIVSVDSSTQITLDVNSTSAETNVTLTAATKQFAGRLISAINEIAVCATIGDAVTMPFAKPGKKVTIINNGASACDVFPNSSDDLGAGDNIAVSLAAGSNITYVAYTTKYWNQI